MVKKKSKKTTKSVNSKRSIFKLSRQNSIVLGSLLVTLSIAFFIAFTSYFIHWQEDQSIVTEFANRELQAKNWLSKFGANVSHFLIYKGFGVATYILTYLLFITGAGMVLNRSKKSLVNTWFWSILIMVWFAVLFGFFTEKFPLLGGVVGFELNDFLQDYIGKAGVILLLAFVGITYMVVRLKITPEKIAALFKRKELNASENLSSPEETTNSSSLTEENEQNEATEVVFSDTTSEESTVTAESIAIKNQNNNTENEDSDLKVEVEQPEEEEVTDVLANKLVEDFGEFDPTLELSNYKFPTLELLSDHGVKSSITINQEELEANKKRIVKTLEQYKIGIAHIKATIGPTVTLYEIVPAAGIRISKIKNLEDDIALSLSALGIRIIAPIPGKGTIGIEVPNKNASIVSMRSVIASQKFQNAEMELPIALGKTISNETFVVDLAKMPHLLMAGATGQGKSVGLNAILTSLLYKKHPAEVKFVLVDPKKVELTLFNKIERHFLAKLPDTEEAIITDNTKVINTLNSLCIEMDNRYELLKNAMVRNIKEYNAKFKARKLNPNDGHKFLPYIVLIIDEFADLIMTAGKEVETPIARLAQLARAVGIHLIIATQRPSVNVITGIIKANFPARIAFRVTSKIDSRTILDTQGADQLIGRGDMLYTQGNDLIRLQCAFVDTPEVAKITEYIGSQRAYPEAHILPEYVGEESGTSIDVSIEDRDPLFNQAAEVIVTAQQGSASLLQRKLKLGYNRAGRLIDQLEAAGIVGPFEGSKARQVLVPDLTSLEQLLNNEKNNN